MSQLPRLQKLTNQTTVLGAKGVNPTDPQSFIGVVVQSAYGLGQEVITGVCDEGFQVEMRLPGKTPLRGIRPLHEYCMRISWAA